MCEDGEDRNMKCACVGDLYLYEHQLKRLIVRNFEGKFREKEKERKRGDRSLTRVQFKFCLFYNKSHDYRQYFGLGWG